VRIGGRVAATITRWSMQYGKGQYTLEGACTDTDAYWLGLPGPWELRLLLGQTTYRLPAVAISVSGDELTAHGSGHLEGL
jgi:hypothetical protein